MCIRDCTLGGGKIFAGIIAAEILKIGELENDMTQDDKKRAVAEAALAYLSPGGTIGIGTGSTANYFIDALARIKHDVPATVASSLASARRLESHGIRVVDLNSVDSLDIYVDGADESTTERHLIKGGGGALTREKIVAAVAKTFVCIVDDSKLVERLGAFPLPIEVIASARNHVIAQIRQLGGDACLRVDFTTDNGNQILDVHGLDLTDPVAMESTLNQITGTVTNGLFAQRPADLLLVGGTTGVTAHGKR